MRCGRAAAGTFKDKTYKAIVFVFFTRLNLNSAMTLLQVY